MKVLVWNVEKFTEAKFQAKVIITGNWSKKRLRLPIDELLAYMEMVFTGNGNASHTPEVIAILEALAPDNQDLGELLDRNSGGARGLVAMLNYIKQWTNNNNWRLVPPLKCNTQKPANTPWAQSEVVGVFYDTSRVTFNGPNAWINNQSQQPGAGAAAQYDAGVNSIWNDAAITNSTTLAGQVRFYETNGNEILFPNDQNRRPFLVDFTEQYGNNRKIRMAFMHTSPGFHLGGTRSMGKIAELTPTGGTDPTISIAAGDFNVNDYHTNSANKAYRPLSNRRFRKMLKKNEDYSTHYYRKRDAKPDTWDTYQQHMLIDNFLVWHRTKTAANQATYEKASVDAALGFPNPYVSTMNIPIANYPNYTNPVEAFRWWENFWHIRKASDHTPIFLDIQ
ncbi:hypothetical protein DUZ99_14635 [Xylanibacillus composti]|uniref:hypothetical protein n=1 Tax=Xylanibacillus composti TaxID=1572762 RepID=UPI001BCBC6A1|nr:hypothetical protein [Xylanibacillus composti]MDT9726215.1 hypothetical protein [Xylanibacillus composti]